MTGGLPAATYDGGYRAGMQIAQLLELLQQVVRGSPTTTTVRESGGGWGPAVLMPLHASSSLSHIRGCDLRG